jgi:hypothetical protein
MVDSVLKEPAAFVFRVGFLKNVGDHIPNHALLYPTRPESEYNFFIPHLLGSLVV